MNLRRKKSLVALAAAVAVGLSALTWRQTAHAQAPVLPTLGAEQEEALARALRSVEEETWDWARKMAGEVGEPVLADWVDWRRALDGDTELAYPDDLGLLDRFAGWPGSERLRAKLEASMDGGVPLDERLERFARSPAVSAHGRLRHAQALLEAGFDRQAAELARRSWADDDFGRTDEALFLELFGPLLRDSDHAARLDRLLWDGRLSDARRVLPLVDEDHRRLGEARILLTTDSSGVDRAILRVPSALSDHPGLAFERLRWRDRRGRDEGVRAILLNPPERLGRASVWWQARAKQVRKLLDENRPLEAYRLSRGHGQNGGLTGAEANFLHGWLALRFANEPEEAMAAFETLHANVRSPISRARGAYWAGRAAEAAGQHARAARWFATAASHPTTFYGQVALDRLGAELRVPAPDFAAPLGSLAAEPFARLASLLCRRGSSDAALPFLERLLEDGRDPAAVMSLAGSCGDGELLVILGKRGTMTGLLDAVWSFPQPQGAAAAKPDALVLAVSRQESHFDPEAVSRAGAKGLMQLMPRTAEAMARKAGLPYSNARLTADPAYNMALGSRYLAELAERFDGHLPLMAAAYNAGPSRAARWMEEQGDPRGMSTDDAIDWMEMIPFRETRNYVQRVVEGHRTYQALLDPSRLDGAAGAPRPEAPPPGVTGLIPSPKPTRGVEAGTAGTPLTPVPRPASVTASLSGDLR